MKVSTTASLVAVLPFAVVAMANRADTGKIPSQERPEKSTEEIMRRLEEVNSYDEYDLTEYGGDGSYNYDYVERSGGCSADYTDVTCYGGTVMISTSCDDATCSSCGLTIDHTAFTGGQYTCDETYFYVNSQLGGDLPGCFCDDNGGSYFNGGEDEEEVNSYAYDVIDNGGSYSYDGGMIDYGGLYSYDGSNGGDGSYSYDYVESSNGGLYSYSFSHSYSYSYDCVPSHFLLSCDGGSLIVADGCADDTCSDCASTMDYTAWTGGEWYCDDTYFYQDVGGDGSFESMGPLMCYYDSCGGGDSGDDDDDGGDCFDTDNGATDSYGDSCSDYVGNPSWCGGYDDNDFSSDDMCCACDGGSENASPDCVPSHSSYSCDGGSFIVADGCADDTCSDCASTMDYTAWTGGEWYCDDTYFYQDVGGDGSFESMGPLMCYYDSCGGGDGGDDDDDGGDCFDTDNGATDPYGDGCGYYDAYPSDCGGYDDNDFSSDDMCCACDGGSENASPDCVPSHSSYSCDGGSFIVADGCADDTCSDCASTLDYTAWTGGEWYCDDTYFYQDVGGDGSFETMGPLMCYYDSCGGGDEDEEEVNSYAYDVVDYVGSYSYDGGMIDYGGSYSYGGDDDGGSYSYLFSSEGAPTPTAVPTGPSLSPTTLPTSEPTPLVVLSALATVSLAGFSCSDYTDAEATVLEQAMGDVITNLQSTEAIGCTSNRRLTDRDTQHLRYGRRLDDGASASIGMSMSALSHHTDSTTSSELAAEINDALASAASTGSLASAISSRASDAGLASLSSVSVSSVTVSTLSPTEQPTTFPSSSPTGRPTTPAPTPRPTGVYCTDGVLNGDETSIDCGGTCPACAFGESCGVDSDCASSACQGGVCITSPPTAAPTLACEDLEFTPPQLQEAKFSQTAGQLLLTWSLSTDRAGLGGASFDCDLLLDFPAVSYATCVWTSQQSLTATLDYRATCVPGDTITALEGRLSPACTYHDCSCWPTANASSTPLLVPDNPLMPVALFVAPGQVGSCSDLTIDATSSTGSGGRGWQTAVWTVNGSLPDKNLTLVRSFAMNMSIGDKPWMVGSEAVLNIPNTPYLQRGHTYSFVLSLTNFLGFALTSDALSVNVALGAIPNLVMTSGASYAMLAPAQLSVFAAASVAACPGASMRTSLTYVWSCSYLGGSPLDVTSSSVDPRYFKLPPFTFNASQQYILGVTVVDVNGYNNSVSTKVLVGTSDLVAAIDGGDRNAPTGSTITLDASPSFDPDSPDTSSSLLFEWKCAVLTGTGTCPGDMDDVSLITTVLDTVGEYEFQVTLRKYSKGAWRNVSSSILIEAINSVPPPVSVAALAISKVNPSEKLILTGTSGPAVAPFGLEWSLTSGDLPSGSLADRATTSLTDSVVADISDTNYLVLPPDSLTAGAAYEFTLTASYADASNGVAGYSVLSIRVNAPPSSGLLTISPDEGVVLQTPYLFKASGWVDDLTDLPLLYSFYYIIYGTVVEYQIVSNTPSASRDGTLLPRGGGNASQIVGVSYAADQLGAATRSTAVVVCEAVSVSVTDLANITGQLLAASLESGDVEGMFGAMVASSSLLNSVNCTVPCGSLDRETCPVDGVCGQCATGYVGLVGPSNAPCYVETGNCSNGIVDSNETDVDCGGHGCAPCQSGSTCLADADCYYGLCQSTANNSGLCVTPPKQCANNCSSHGSCSRWDTTGAHLRRDECAADDWSCMAVCSCSTGWYGESCSYDEIAYAEVIALRNSMLGSLGDASGMQDVTSSALNQQASSLSSLAADPSQLSGGGEFTTLGLVGNIAGGSADAGLSGGTADSVGNTVSSLLGSSLLSNNVSTYMPTTAPTVHVTSALRRRLMGEFPTAAPSTATDSAAIMAINDAIGSLSSAQLGNAVAGEAAATIATANVMMASSRAFASDAATSSSSPPPNAGGAAPAVSLGASVAVAYEDGTEVASDTPVDTQVQQWGYNIYADSAGTSTTSSLVSLSVSTNEGGRRRRLKLMERRRLEEDGSDDAEPLIIVLQNVRPIDYSLSSADEYVDLVCEEGFIGETNATCPGTNATTKVVCDGRYPITQNGIVTGFATNWSTRISCSVTAVPSCLLWDSALQTYDSMSCSPKNWTSTNTTCACGAQASEVVTGSGASFTSGSAALLGYFASTFSASSFGANMFAQNPELMITFGVMLIILLINIALGIKHDQQDHAAEWTVLESKKTRFEAGRLDLEPLRVSAGVADSVEMRQAVQNEHTTAAFANASLPDFVTDKSSMGTITRVIAEEHSWVSASAWGAYDPSIPRHIKSQVLAIQILWVMVSQAVYRQFTNPDLGCGLYTTEDDCLVMDAAWPAEGNACVWDITLEEPCYTAPADTSNQFSLLNMLLIAVVMMCTKPFDVAVAWTYDLIFNAATARSRSKAMMDMASEQQRYVWSVITAPGQEMEGADEGPDEADAEENAGHDRKRKFNMHAISKGFKVGGQFGAPPSAEGNADEEFPGLATYTVIAPASRLGLGFLMCDLTKFARVAYIDSSSPLVGKVRLGDMLVQIDDDAPIRQLGTVSRVGAVLLAREGCTRALHFVANRVAMDTEDQFKSMKLLPLRAPPDLDTALFADAEMMLHGGGAPPIAENNNDAERQPSGVIKRTKSIVTSVATGNLPSNDKREFNAYVEMITARQCVAVLARQEELVEALVALEERSNSPDVIPAVLSERDAVAKLVTDFRKRWKLEQPSALCDCLMGRGNETAEEKLNRTVMSKVKNDVRQAIKWDEELSSLSVQGQEKYFLELARFELLSFAEKQIYLKNGGCAIDPEPPAPVKFITKLVAAFVIIVLTLFPAMYLLLFGVQQGREVTRLWLIGFLFCLTISLVIVEPIKVSILFGLLPSLVRRKIKQLADPTRASTFPFKTVLFEHPTTYLAHKHPGLVVAQSALVNRGALADLGEEQPTLPIAGTVRHHRASVNTRAQLLVVFWATVLLLPEDLQDMVIENTIFFGTILLTALTKLIAELAHHFKAVSIFAVFVIVCIILYLCKRKHKAFGVKDDEQQEEERVLEEILRKTIFGESPASTATPEGTMALTVDEASVAVQFAKEEVLLGEGQESEPEASSSWWGNQ